MLGAISYPPIPLIEVGPLRLSLHGLMAAVGFLVGAVLMIREARRRGFDEAKITSVLTWALIGAIVGARLLTVPAHLDEGFIEAIQPFKSFSIMGGFAGGILVGLWRVRMLRLPALPHLDMAAFGLAAGTVVVLALFWPPGARAATSDEGRNVVERRVTFTVANTNTSDLACPSDLART